MQPNPYSFKHRRNSGYVNCRPNLLRYSGVSLNSDFKMKFFLFSLALLSFNLKADFEYKLTCELGSSIYYIFLVPSKKDSWYMRVDGKSEYDLDSKTYFTWIRARKYGQKVRILGLYKVKPDLISFGMAGFGTLSINRASMKTFYKIPGEVGIPGICHTGFKIYKTGI